jgi:hypothetical protein
MVLLEGVLTGGGAMLALGLTMMCLYEFYALTHGVVPPITTIVRYNVGRHEYRAISIATLIALLAGWLIGHLGK